MTKIEKLFSLKNFEYIEYYFKKHHVEKLDEILNYFTFKEIKNYHKCLYRFILHDIQGSWIDRLIKIKSLSNDSSSLEVYILKFGEEIGTELFNIKTDKSTVKKDIYILENMV